ncbi:MAG: glycosyltransferase [Chitinophagaceae bacterium]|nr:glycosyltransferase [Chitinophagaceae bacterium]
MPEQSPLVSIIMPVYNGEAFLQEAINSVLKQTYTNWELLVINDGSTDGSRDVVLANTDPRVRLIDNEQNMGIIHTRNRGIDLASGKYIAWLDADDIALPTRIEKQVRFLEKYPDCGAVATIFQQLTTDGTLGKVYEFPTGRKEVKTHLLIENCICNSSTMLPATLMKNSKYLHEFEVAEDYELWDRVSSSHYICIIPEILTHYRVHGNNVSIKKKEQMFVTVKHLSARMLAAAGLGFTDKQLELHSDLISYSNKLTASGADFKEMEKWVVTILKHFRHLDTYDYPTMYRMMAERHAVACVHTKRYARLFWNPIMRMHPFKYLAIVIAKLRGQSIKFPKSNNAPV